MKKRPILFSAPMVRAILEGRKTQTRRIVKPQPPADAALPKVHDENDVVIELRDKLSWFVPDGGDLWPCRREDAIVCPYGHLDRLWVRETFRLPAQFDRLSPQEAWDFSHLLPVSRDADGPPCSDGWGRARPSIHMPRWASRITLRVTSIRVERLQAITTADVDAEGIVVPPCDYTVPEDPRVLDGERWAYARGLFAKLWDEINGARASWASNPWVWIVGFEREVPA